MGVFFVGLLFIDGGKVAFDQEDGDNIVDRPGGESHALGD
jgi:hypothetical protein